MNKVIPIFLTHFILAFAGEATVGSSKLLAEEVSGKTKINVSSTVAPSNRGQQLRIIPAPVAEKFGEGLFTLPEICMISSELAENTTAGYLQRQLGEIGVRTSLAQTSSADADIVLKIADLGMGTEGYQLRVSTTGVVVIGQSERGLFWGIQTLLQMCPPMVQPGKAVVLGVVDIQDQPRFPYRGMHLDVARHFFTVPEVKTYIDYMAMHKLNTFHWHLTEDQGWRIQIKKYPKLTEIGAKRSSSPQKGNRNAQDGIVYGPYFYTQEQVKEVVAYAAERQIEVIPEIEMPGHSVAALTAYPELGCTGGPYQVWTRWGVSEEVFCAGKEESFRFLEGVIDEIAPLFPSKYIHIGGDECPKSRWNNCPSCKKRMSDNQLKNGDQLQSYFITRMEKYINGKGKRIIGWDEILEGGLAPNATVMSWRGTEGGIHAAKMGHDVIMTPTQFLYFDYGQAKGPNEPEVIGGILSLSKVYSYNPTDGIPEDKQKHVLGAQGNAWSEYLFDFSCVEYNTLPRMAALAELTWTTQSRKNYSDFCRRLPNLLSRYERMGANYRMSEDVLLEKSKD